MEISQVFEPPAATGDTVFDIATGFRPKMRPGVLLHAQFANMHLGLRQRGNGAPGIWTGRGVRLAADHFHTNGDSTDGGGTEGGGNGGKNFSP